MRLMLGKNNVPSLLVEVDESDYNLNEFNFNVVNGAWEGIYNRMFRLVYVCYTKDTVYDVEILSDNQDRLRSGGIGVRGYWDNRYNDVFENFSNPDYVAPKREVVKQPDDWDDDIAY